MKSLTQIVVALRAGGIASLVLALASVSESAVGQATEYLDVNWQWIITGPTVTVGNSPLVVSKLWVSNPNPVPDYVGTPLTSAFTISASLKLDDYTLPAGATDVSITGLPTSVSLSVQTSYLVVGEPAETRPGYRTELFGANGVSFSLTDGQSYGGSASASTFLMKPPEANTQDWLVSATFSVVFTEHVSGPISGTARISYTTSSTPPTGPTIPEPKTCAALAGLPLMAWGIFRRARSAAKG